MANTLKEFVEKEVVKEFNSLQAGTVVGYAGDKTKEPAIWQGDENKPVKLSSDLKKESKEEKTPEKFDSMKEFMKRLGFEFAGANNRIPTGVYVPKDDPKKKQTKETIEKIHSEMNKDKPTALGFTLPDNTKMSI